ncbi:probable cytochrome P450 6d5 [Bradysia coprophila]|uniref:probable cytochrome P450 6d5 n=1 Tax=Bradysia coprophila TaxID=38358 RepID=UPI00187D829F|nr:probable cytochrome P450 6d5 [Bradysia coprophila]
MKDYQLPKLVKGKMSLIPIFVAFLSVVIVTLYLFVKRSYSYWERQGVPYKKPTFPLGNFTKSFLKQKSFAQDLQDLYNETSEPFYGVYSTITPALLIRDPRLIQNILVKDSQYFDEPGQHASTDVDPMADNLLLQHGEKWKRMRTKLSQAFTSGKLKGMLPTIIDCGKSMEKYIEKFANTNESIELRQIFAHYATNVIVSVAFGLEIDCFETDNEFSTNVVRVFFKPSFRAMVRSNFQTLLSPKLIKLFGVRFADKEVGDFLIETVRQNLEYREKNNVTRRDLFQLLMQIRNEGQVKEDDNWTTETKSGHKSLTIEDIAAQSLLFFLGGFDSSSSAMSFFLYELAKHPNIQQKVSDEIEEVIRRHDGELTYDAVSQMKYFSCCFTECLRLYPPFPGISRICTTDYKIPGTSVVIEKGTSVIISSLGLHYDRSYYDEPEKFIPERHNESQRLQKSFIEMPNITFGEGARNCIGRRLARLNSSVGLLLLLRKFRFELGDVHKNNENKISPTNFILALENGINLKVVTR